MDLYFSPLACSLATRIALYEAGAEANYLEVDPKTKVVQKDGSDFRTVNPLGLVPTLRTDDGAGADRERRDPAICRRPFSAGRHRAPDPAWNAAGCINGSASSAPNCTRDCSCRCSTRRRRRK